MARFKVRATNRGVGFTVRVRLRLRVRVGLMRVRFKSRLINN